MSAIAFRNYCMEEAIFLAKRGAWMASDCIRNRLDMFERAGAGPDVQPTPAQLERIARAKRHAAALLSDGEATEQVLCMNDGLSLELFKWPPQAVMERYLTANKKDGRMALGREMKDT